MQEQYKLYKIDKVAVADVLKQLRLDAMYQFNVIADNVIALQYDYSNRSYGCLLEYMSHFKASQYIITASTFYTLLHCISDSDIKILEINMSGSLGDVNKDLSGLIQKFNQEASNSKFLDKLLDELQWYNYDEGIDIHYVSFLTKRLNSDQLFKSSIFNNGVITVDSNQIWDQIAGLLKCLLTL